MGSRKVAQSANPAFFTARVSPNGRYLAFMRHATITGYYNVDVNPNASGARDEEVFLYEPGGSAVRCVSCNHTAPARLGILDHNEAGEGFGLLVDRTKIWFNSAKNTGWAGNRPGLDHRSPCRADVSVA